MAPRLALAAACELAGDRRRAARRYERVWRVDHGYVSAAFGLARTRAAAGDRAGAVAVLDEVPDTSSQYIAAQVAALRPAPRRRGRRDRRGRPGRGGVDRLERLRLDAAAHAGLAVEMFLAALGCLGGGRGRDRAGATRSRGTVSAPVCSVRY